MPPGECLEALTNSSEQESSRSDTTFEQGFLWRKRRELLELRFKRTFVRVVVHSWFRVVFVPLERGTRIDVTQRIGLSKGWWLPGLYIAAFYSTFNVAFGLLVLRKFPWRLIASMSSLFQIAALILSALVAFLVYDGDSLRMIAHLRKVLNASELPNTALQRM
jgi:hypothetical protein